MKEQPKKGTKNDQDKPPLDLLTLEFLTGTAKALGFGAGKYGRHNFREGIDHSRLIAAALRHLNQYNAGTDEDAESGLSHLAHAAASLNMLMWMVENRPELDDRYKGNSKKSTEYRFKCDSCSALWPPPHISGYSSPDAIKLPFTCPDCKKDKK